MAICIAHKKEQTSQAQFHEVNAYKQLAYCGRVKQTAGVEIFCKFWRIGSIEQPKRPKVNGAKDQNKGRNYCIDEA